MKKIYTVLLFFYSAILLAAPINQVIFFGDSLSDNGNLYRKTWHHIPKSPPYYTGRFSNGPTWAEDMGEYFKQEKQINYKIYAVGGATAIWHFPEKKYVAPTILKYEVKKYLKDSLFTSNENTLFVIWIGANDYLFGDEKDLDTFTTHVVDKIQWAMETLIKHGATTFLILNVPDLAHTPFGMNSPDNSRLTILPMLHNQKLAAMLQSMQTIHPTITVKTIDVYGFLTTGIRDLDQFNQAHHTHIKYTTTACWYGRNGFFDFSALATSNASPVLALAEDSGKAYDEGLQPCADPDDYLFWDPVHPTRVIHQVLSQMAIDELESTISSS